MLDSGIFNCFLAMLLHICVLRILGELLIRYMKRSVYLPYPLTSCSDGDCRYRKILSCYTFFILKVSQFDVTILAL